MPSNELATTLPTIGVFEKMETRMQKRLVHIPTKNSHTEEDSDSRVLDQQFNSIQIAIKYFIF